MLIRRAILCLLILATATSPSFGQARSSTARSTFSIAGNVRDDNGQNTMENVRVDLKLAAGSPINTTFTRGNGEFEFDNLTNGEYVIEVNLKDYDTYRQTVVLDGGSQRGITVFLSRPVTLGATSSRASVSAHELSVPSKPREEYEKGLQLLYAKSDYQGALVQFQRAIRDFATFYEAYAQEGSAYRELKQIGPAEQAMRKSIELSSGQYSEAIFLLSGLLNDGTRYADAATTVRQGIEVDAASWHGPYELARALSGLKQLDEAEKSAIEARDMKPDNPPTYLILANIHIQRHDYPALIKDLDAYLKLVPNGPDAEQARETRDDLQAAMQRAENQAQAKAQEKPHIEAQQDGTSHANRPAAASVKESPPPPEADPSGLPSLPPPTSDGDQ